MRNTMIGMLAVAAGLLLAPCLQASGGHYPVDDATITAPGDCQLESWFTRVNGGTWELAALPACTSPGTPVELTLGLYRLSVDDQSFNRIEPAAKWLIQPVTPGNWGGAMEVQVGYEDGDFVNTLLNFPATYEFVHAPVLLHLNLGWLRERDAENNWRNRLFSGLGLKYQALAQLGIIGQVYREGADADPEVQLGLRFDVGGPFDHLDVAVGRQLEGERDTFATAGFAIIF